MKTILLVEDDAAIRHAISIAFAEDLYQVIAFDRCTPVMDGRVSCPDLFIIDKNISGMDGAALCAFIKQSKIYQQAPVLLISASPGIAELAKEAGADGCLAKPFTLKMLRQTVSNAING